MYERTETFFSNIVIDEYFRSVKNYRETKMITKNNG